MAKTPPKETSKAAEEPQSEPQAQERREVKVDDAGILATYANFCRVTGTPEELIIDFGLNPQPVGLAGLNQFGGFQRQFRTELIELSEFIVCAPFRGPPLVCGTDSVGATQQDQHTQSSECHGSLSSYQRARSPWIDVSGAGC